MPANASGNHALSQRGSIHDLTLTFREILPDRVAHDVGVRLDRLKGGLSHARPSGSSSAPEYAMGRIRASARFGVSLADLAHGDNPGISAR